MLVNFKDQNGTGKYTFFSELTWPMRYIYYYNLQVLGNVIIIKNQVLLPQEEVTLADFGFPAYALWFYGYQKHFNYLGFQSFDSGRN